ncbi:MAG: TRIC cation channel family protein [Campylobacterales bacterium]|nr:TRIC cation channel family protein [Campylobacterales bacterium]
MILETSEYIGITAFTISGFYIAVRHNLDILGIFILSFLTALGGGIVRDTIVGIAPVSFTTIYPSLIVVFVVNLLLILKFHKKTNLDRKPIFIFADSLGLVSFSIAGSIIAINSGYEISGVVILSFLTAIGGGILRDILINEVPYILRGGFYGIIAIIIGVVIYLLNLFNLLQLTNITILFIAMVSLRLIAFYKNWQLPNIYKKIK